MSGENRKGWPDLLLAVLLGGGAFALYALTLAPTVLAGDGGEFQFVPYLLGIAHPTGYPLYSLLGWIWSHLLPVGDVAYRMNLFSAFWAALAVGLLYPTARILLRQAIPGLPLTVLRLLAALTTATFALTPTLWSQAVIAEVYSLHIFFVVLLLYFLMVWTKSRDTRLLLAAACTFGLSLAHHRTTLLLAPAILAYLWLTDRRIFRDPRLILKAFLALLIPLALYLYIPLRAPHTPYLHLPLTAGRDLVLYENTLPGFVSFVLGGPFGGSVDFSIDVGQRLAMSWGFLRNELGWLALALALVGLARLVASRLWALLALTGLTYLGVVAFNLVYTIGDIYVMYIPSYLIIVSWMAVGVGTLAQGLEKIGPQRSGRDRRGRSPAGRSVPFIIIAIVLLFFALPLWMALHHYADIDQSHNSRARERWEAILAEPLPPGAVLISNDRNNIMPMWYFQYVDDLRPDLLGLFPLITVDHPTLGHVFDLALSTGRPVYLIKEMPGAEIKVQVEPEGSFWRLIGPAVEGAPAHPRDLRLADAVTLSGFDRSPHSPRPGEALQVSLYWEALHPLEADYHSFVHMLDAEGQVLAQSDQQPGGVHYPTTLWRPGERLRDDHVLNLPHDAPAGVYRLLVGMYALSGDGELLPLGEPVVAGQVAIKTGVQTDPGDMAHLAGGDFAGLIELLGYDVAPQEGMLAVTLHWRGLQPPDADYTVFVHLLDGSGQVVAQHDGEPQGGAHPTAIWDAGEVVVDEHLLSLPSDLPPGDYRLRVGLYLLQTGERLPVVGGGNSVEFGPLQPLK